MKNNEIVPYSYPIRDINFIMPDKPKEASAKVIKELQNSYNKCCFLDEIGQVWFEAEKLHSILRTTKINAKFYIDRISDESKLYFNNEVYILGYEIIKIIDKFIQGEATGKRTIYLRFSEAIYKAIRDTPEAQVLRTKYQITLKEERKKLKNKRIKKYKIKKDELTDNALIKHRAEFSHIRSFAIFKDIADDIENGLIVNKSTHEIITKEGINDEDELLILCKEKGWKNDWYNKFKCYFELN